MLLEKYDEKILQTGYTAYEHFKKEYHYTKVIPAFLEQLYNKEFKFRRKIITYTSRSSFIGISMSMVNS